MDSVVMDLSLYDGGNHRNQTASQKATCPKDAEGLCRHRGQTCFLVRKKATL